MPLGSKYKRREYTHDLGNTYTVCLQLGRTDHILNIWSCTPGFNSMDEADNYVEKHRSSNTEMVSRIFIQSFITPLFIHQLHIKMGLIPYVSYKDV